MSEDLIASSNPTPSPATNTAAATTAAAAAGSSSSDSGSSNVTSSTTIKTLDELRAKAPEVYNMTILSLEEMCRDQMQHFQEHLQEANQET